MSNPLAIGLFILVILFVVVNAVSLVLTIIKKRKEKKSLFDTSETADSLPTDNKD